MRSSIRVARVLGIPVSVHVTFLLFLAFLVLVYLFHGGPAAALRGLVFILALFVSVTLHELGHSLVARRFGVKVSEILLLPIGGVSRMEDLPEKPQEEFLIALAGPATSVALGIVLGGASLAIYGPAAALRAGVDRGPFLSGLAQVNLLLAGFNLLPGFPMDGGRILRSILARSTSFVRATVIAANVGRLFAVVLAVVGIFSNVWLVFIAVFIYLGAGEEARAVRMRAALHDIPVTRVMARTFQEVAPGDRLARAVELAYHGFQEDFPVTSQGRVVGILQRGDILAALHEFGPDVAVSQVMKTDFQTVAATDTLEHVLEALQRCRCSSLPVVEEGRIAGLVTMEAVGRYFMFSSAASGRV